MYYPPCPFAPLLLILLLAPTFAPPPQAPTTVRTRRIKFTECNAREPDRHHVGHRASDNRLRMRETRQWGTVEL
jgi:hypothetical protein